MDKEMTPIFTEAELTEFKDRAKEISKRPEEMQKYLTPEQTQLFNSIDETLTKLKNF